MGRANPGREVSLAGLPKTVEWLITLAGTKVSGTVLILFSFANERKSHLNSIEPQSQLSRCVAIRFHYGPPVRIRSDAQT